MQALEHRDERGEADREGRQKEMPRDDPGELEPRQKKRIEMHSLLSLRGGRLHWIGPILHADCDNRSRGLRRFVRGLAGRN